MNVLLLRWDTKPDKRIRRTFLHPASTRRTSFYAADRAEPLQPETGCELIEVTGQPTGEVSLAAPPSAGVDHLVPV